MTRHSSPDENAAVCHRWFALQFVIFTFGLAETDCLHRAYRVYATSSYTSTMYDCDDQESMCRFVLPLRRGSLLYRILSTPHVSIYIMSRSIVPRSLFVILAQVSRTLSSPFVNYIVYPPLKISGNIVYPPLEISGTCLRRLWVGPSHSRTAARSPLLSRHRCSHRTTRLALINLSQGASPRGSCGRCHFRRPRYGFAADVCNFG